MYLENPKEYENKKYGNTTILKYLGKYRDNTYYYKCLCDCGNEFYIRMREKDKVRKCCTYCLSKTLNRGKKPAVYEYNGEKIYLKDLAKKLNISFGTLCSRIYINKWNKERWAEPVNRRNK